MQVLSAGRGDRRGRKHVRVERRGESSHLGGWHTLESRCWETRAVLQTLQLGEQT